jgi:hypothetical protein
VQRAERTMDLEGILENEISAAFTGFVG